MIDFGSGTLELKVKPKHGLDDGEWHRIDIFWDTEVLILLSGIVKHSAMRSDYCT